MDDISTNPQPFVKPVGKQIRSIQEKRLDHFTDERQYREQNLLPKLTLGVADDHHVKLSVYSAPNLSRPTFAEATRNEFTPTRKGEAFGPSWSTHWFKVRISVPESLIHHEHLEFHWNSSSEAMVWSESGEPLQGLSGGGEKIPGGGIREEWKLPSQWKDGKEHVFYLEMACNTLFGNAAHDDIIQPPPTNKYFRLEKADIVAINLGARQLLFDFQITRDAARILPQDSWEAHLAMKTCTSIMDTFSRGEGSDDAIAKCREIASQYLDQQPNTDSDAMVTAIGHCHIDTCWLWPWVETKRKVARSWISQCNLMDEYPEYRFCCSQAQQYQWLEELYPTIFKRIKEKITAGAFHPIGGSWVEHDTNMPSGESLIRQFLYGQRYFESRFGQRHTTFWLPDTFGYTSQLPQICRLAGFTRFFTQKLSWNNINKFPHTTFRWVALDGRSDVLCHMTPADKYNAEANLADVTRCVTNHKSLDQDPTSLLVYGHGDGGGGPTRQHLEGLRRCRDRVKLGPSVDDFFAQLECKAAEGKAEFATWFGELYFERHRGTYTTQAKMKRNNRGAEILLHDVEWLATLASLRGYKYPKADIDRMWENVLLCQFHDCLPGSAIEMCYDDSDKLYETVFRLGDKILQDAGTTLGLNVKPTDTENLVGVNTLNWIRTTLVDLPTGEYGLFGGGPGAATISAPRVEAPATVSAGINGEWILSNSQYRATVSNGTITSLYDIRADREVIPRSSRANEFVLFDDKPLYHQAWDVETYHLGLDQALHGEASTATENGPYRASVTTMTRISGQSWVKSVISLTAALDADDETHIECSAEVEWRETMKFLKVQFPVDVSNTHASYETQFGIVERPTHYNTSWDMAKFEVCCHKWADLSEATYGVSILNDSKYGFATCGNVMRLSLLRSPKAPDANADMGRHHIRWAIFPHRGPLAWQTIRKAFEFNFPVQIASHANPTELKPVVSLRGGTGLVLDTLKRAEDDQDVSRGDFSARSGKSVICRVYDSLGGKDRAVLESGSGRIKKAWKCNILEDDLHEMHVNDGAVEIELQRFEVASYRLLLE